MARKFILSTLIALAPSVAAAQSSLGITGAEFRFGASDTDEIVGQAMVDTAITQVHGLQFNVGYVDEDNASIAYIDSFVYMTPRDGQKYGLTFLFGDVDNISLSYAQIGAIGLLDVSDRLTAEVRGGVGMVTGNDLDWLTAGIGLNWQAAQSIQLYGAYNISEFQEEEFDALAHDVSFGAQYSPRGTPFGVYAEVSQDWLSGQDSTSRDTIVEVGVTVTFGGASNNQPSFSTFDPLRQILRRDLY